MLVLLNVYMLIIEIGTNFERSLNPPERNTVVYFRAKKFPSCDIFIKSNAHFERERERGEKHQYLLCNNDSGW
jgi:hypothetical protein